MPQQTPHHKSPDAVSRLDPEQYRVTLQDGTGRPFANAHWHNHEHGGYRILVASCISATETTSGETT